MSSFIPCIVLFVMFSLMPYCVLFLFFNSRNVALMDWRLMSPTKLTKLNHAVWCAVYVCRLLAGGMCHHHHWLREREDEWKESETKAYLIRSTGAQMFCHWWCDSGWIIISQEESKYITRIIKQIHQHKVESKFDAVTEPPKPNPAVHTSQSFTEWNINMCVCWAMQSFIVCPQIYYVILSDHYSSKHLTNSFLCSMII